MYDAKEFLADYKAKHLIIQEDLELIKRGEITPVPLGDGVRYTQEICGVDGELYHWAYVELDEAEVQEVLDKTKRRDYLLEQMELLQEEIDELEEDERLYALAQLANTSYP